MTLWQPIETAPKDGTQVIAQWPSYSKHVVAHVGAVQWKNEWYELGGRMWDGWWCVGGGLPAKEPTHWQPFPNPLALADGETTLAATKSES